MELVGNAHKLLIEEQRANEARRAFMKYIFHEVGLELELVLWLGLRSGPEIVFGLIIAK
jgi:hypothetical protein